MTNEESTSFQQSSCPEDHSLIIDGRSSMFTQQTQPNPSIISVVPLSCNTPDPEPSKEPKVSILDAESRCDAITGVDDDDDSSQQNTVETASAAGDLFVEDTENCSPNIVDKRKLTDVKVLKSSKKFASSELKFRNFQINWSKISDIILARLQDLQMFRNENPGQCAPRSIQLSKTDWSGLTTSVVDQLRAIDTEIPASVMERVAKDILNKYPCLNFLDDDGYDTGSGFVWIKHKMLNRNSYLNRYKKQSDEPIPTKTEALKNRNVRAGTNKEYWEKTSKECSKDVLSTLARDEPGLLTQEFLQASQAYIRYRFDEDKPLKDIMADFPVLRRKSLLDYHFECATGVAAKSLEQYFTAKRSKLIDFSKTGRKTVHLDTTATDVDILRFLCSLLGEKFDDIAIKKEIGTKIDTISTDCPGPVLVAIDCGNERTVYYVFAEQVRLTEGTESVITAVADLLCVHYVHNFMYMRQISKFLEFTQEYFYKILPATGSKSTAARKGQQQRVVKRVIKDISAYNAH